MWQQNPGNGHWYTWLEGPINWFDADATATSLGGYLATITDSQENDWLADTFNFGDGWIGLVQQPGSVEPDGGWGWVTGEPYVYTNWGPGNPSNADSQGPEDYGIFDDAGLWHDKRGARDQSLGGAPWGAIVEMVPEPTTLVLLGSCAPGLLIRRR
ncbi:MAG: lectin-like protein [Phycisphaerales bacterium]